MSLSNLDEGMMHLVNKGKFNNIYLRKNSKSFAVSEIQKLNAGNGDAIDIILSKRDSRVRQLLKKRMYDDSVYIIYAIEYTRTFLHSLIPAKRKIQKKIVCLFIKNLDFCPGIYYMTTVDEYLNNN